MLPTGCGKGWWSARRWGVFPLAKVWAKQWHWAQLCAIGWELSMQPHTSGQKHGWHWMAGMICWLWTQKASIRWRSSEGSPQGGSKWELKVLCYDWHVSESLGADAGDQGALFGAWIFPCQGSQYWCHRDEWSLWFHVRYLNLAWHFPIAFQESPSHKRSPARLDHWTGHIFCRIQKESFNFVKIKEIQHEGKLAENMLTLLCLGKLYSGTKIWHIDVGAQSFWGHCLQIWSQLMKMKLAGDCFHSKPWTDFQAHTLRGLQKNSLQACVIPLICWNSWEKGQWSYYKGWKVNWHWGGLNNEYTNCSMHCSWRWSCCRNPARLWDGEEWQ